MRVSAVFGRVRALISRHSLRANLVLLLVAVVSILAVDRAAEVARVRADAVKNAALELNDLARYGADLQADVVASAKALLGLAVDLPVSAADAGSSCQPSFAKIVNDLPWLRSLWVVTLDGSALCTNAVGPTALNIADRPVFRAAIDQRGFSMSDFVVGRISGKPGIVAAMPRISGGRVETVVAGMIEVDWLSHITSEIAISRGVEALLIDGAGTVIAAYPDAEKWVGHPLGDPKALAAVVSAPNGTIESMSLGGVRRMISHVRLRDSNAVFAAMRPLDGVVGGANRLARDELLKILVAAFVSFMLIWFGSDRFIVRPLARLTRSAERVGSGDLSTRIDTKGLGPELKRLADSFNRMAEQLYAREADLRQANDRLTDLASKDSMTGIPNRRSFDEQLAGEWHRTRRDRLPLALLAIDVDHFKKFNDCYGHLEGDACLKRVAHVFASTARRPGDFAARTGGEEFALILPGTDIAGATEVAEALRRDVETLNIRHAKSPESRITISIGVATIPVGGGMKLTTLVNQADAALYRAKRAGRNRVIADREAVALAS